MEHPIAHHIEEMKKKIKPPTPGRLVSAVQADGSLVEMLYDPDGRATSFCVDRGDDWRIVKEIAIDGRSYQPYSPENNLIRHGVVLFPSHPEPFENEIKLVEAIKRYLHSYVDLSPLFEEIAAHYVLLTWIYDGFAELPYLRVRGDYGSGKTRFLLILGPICYKPIFASGASTVSPLFRLLDAIGGTLILDESDFRASDERADITKILNNGNARGFPVLRCEAQPSGEYDPRAYSVYGPKIVASRRWFEDRALESRFLTEELGGRKLRPDIPFNLGDDYKAEALTLRNQLLTFRFHHRNDCRVDPSLHDPALEPRLNQIFAPLLSVVREPHLLEKMRYLARDTQRMITDERGEETEASVLQIIRQMLVHGERPAIKAITDRILSAQTVDNFEPITPKWVGALLRRRLHLKTEKRHGTYVLAEGQSAQLAHLFDKYGIENDGDDGTERAISDVPSTLPF